MLMKKKIKRMKILFVTAFLSQTANDEGRSEAKRSGGPKVRNEMEQFDRRERSPKGEALSPVSVATAKETEDSERACSPPKGDRGGIRSGESKFGRAEEANKFEGRSEAKRSGGPKLRNE